MSDSHKPEKSRRKEATLGGSTYQGTMGHETGSDQVQKLHCTVFLFGAIYIPWSLLLWSCSRDLKYLIFIWSNISFTYFQETDLH